MGFERTVMVQKLAKSVQRLNARSASKCSDSAQDPALFVVA
jgi:hypothetical protein